MWTNFYKRILDGFAARGLKRRQEAAVLEEIERIVSETHLTIIPVRKFRKKMIPTIRDAMQYIARLTLEVPGPVNLDPEQANDDALLKAMFLNSEELITLLRSSEALRDFFGSTEAPKAFALMIADQKEKMFFGTEKDGEIVRRDVPQKAVFFEDFKVLAPATDLAQTRIQIQHLALVALFNLALEKINDLVSWKKELEGQRELLEFKVEKPEVSAARADSDPENAFEDQDREALQVLSDVNKKLEEINAGLDTPEDRLAHLCGILKRPEQYLKLNTVSLKLSRLGIRLHPSSTEPSNEFELAQFELGQDLKRVAVWVKAKRQNG